MMSLHENTKAQSTIEFTCAMIVIVFLMFGLVMVLRWAGMDLANRRVTQDYSLTALTGTDPASELDSELGSSTLPMAAVYHGTITNNTN